MPIPRDKPLFGLTILVVDDELAMPLARLIDSLGGSGVAVRSIKSARQYLYDHPEGIDAAVIDLLLLNGNGAELIREMRLVRPNLPCLLISGLDVPTVAREALTGEVFLAKPFSAEALGMFVLEAIGKADTDPPPRDSAEFGEEELGTSEGKR